MFRQISRQFVARWSFIKGFRSLSADQQAGKTGHQTFVDSLGTNYPYSDPETNNPRLPSPSFDLTKLFFSFELPWESRLPPKHFGWVIVPARTGRMEIHPGQSNTHAVLKPGVVSLVDGESTTKYFITGGFAFIHEYMVSIATDEAIPLDHIDPAEVHKLLEDSTQKLRSASTDLEKAEAQIGVDIHSALNAALQEVPQEEGAGTSV